MRHVTVQITKNCKATGLSSTKLASLVKLVCRRFNVSNAAVSIAVVGDATIRRLNKQFLNRRRSTDCLSFDLSDDDTKAQKSFDIVVNAERADRYARIRGHSVRAELALYVTHGLLHNLGFDDSTPARAAKMHKMEDNILRQARFGAVYNKPVRTIDKKRRHRQKSPKQNADQR
jgi:probable rRNA maturation factor